MIPRVKLENLELSRLVCGTNPFLGISHFTKSRNMFLKEYFSDVNKIFEITSYLFEEYGVNCIVSSPRDKIYEVVKKMEKEFGEPYYWLCTPSDNRITAKGLSRDLKSQIKWCAEHNVAVCMPHRSWTDTNLNPKEKKIKDLKKYTNLIRDLGMIPGVSTHYFESLQAVEKNNYDVPLIIQPLNTIGFQSNIEVNTLITHIKSTKRQILVIKPMAAGRLIPEVGLNFAFNNIKENDFVACGFDNLQNADYDAQLVDEILKK
ncbi:MAG: hypothetical protein ACTSU2_06170 [Promethearchaeota archaeon]